MSSVPAAGARTVEFLVRSAGLGKGLGAGDAEGAVGGDQDQRTAAINHRELLVREPIGLHVAQAVPATRFGVRMRQCATVTGASLASAPASKMLCRRRGKGVRNRRAGNNLPLGRVGLIHLLLLEKNRPDSRNGCSSREMRFD